MNTIPTDAELYGWLVLLVIAILGIIAFFIIARIAEYNEARRMLSHYDYTEYHDDMEDLS